MRKTTKQPQFKPKVSIKIPKHLETKQVYPIFEVIKSRHVVTKKQIITQYQSKNQLPSNLSHQPIFKIKTFAAGFRTKSTSQSKIQHYKTPRPIKSYSSLRTKPQVKCQWSQVYIPNLPPKNKQNNQPLKKTINQQPDIIPIHQSSSSSQLSWDGQMQQYSMGGFGVSNNLSLYDLPSLEDPQGRSFMEQFRGKTVKCPLFKDKKYDWVNGVVQDFDIVSNKAILRIEDSKVVKVSRMSVRGSQDEKLYWLRIKMAKKERNRRKQQIKYTKYIDQRKQIFHCQFAYNTQIPANYLQEIQKKCLTRYCRQFVVYFEMVKQPTKFKQIGIKLRKYMAFKQNVLYKPFNKYHPIQQLISKSHYSKIKPISQSLISLRSKLEIQNVKTFFNPTQTLKITSFVSINIEHLHKTMDKVKKIRQLIISEIIYHLKNCFSNEKEQIKYYKLHNYIFIEMLTSNLYEYNCNEYLKFLKSFCSFNKQNPIIFLFVKMNVFQKKIECQPNNQQVLQCLMKPLLLLQQLFCKLPDLMDDLSFSKTRFIELKQPIDKESTLIQTITYSYNKINDYICQMMYYVKYFGKMQFRKYQFQFHTILTYKSILSQIQKDLKDVLHRTLYKSGIFVVNLNQVKQSISIAIIKTKNKFFKLIQKQVIQQCQNKKLQFIEIIKKLEFKPTNEIQLIQMRKYINKDCQIFYQNSKSHYKLCTQFYNLLQSHFYVYNGKQYEKALSMISQQYKLIQKMNKKIYELIEIQKQLIEKINMEREQILRGLDEARDQILKIQIFSSIDQYYQNYKQTSKSYDKLQEYQAKLLDINFRQETLKQQLSHFPSLSKFVKQLQPFYDMWRNIYNFTTDQRVWSQQPIISLNYQQIQHKIIEIYGKQFNRLAKIFLNLKNSAATMICDVGSQRVQKLKQKIWIINSLTKQGLLKKQNMMKDIIKKVYNSQEQRTIESVNLDSLLKIGVDKYKQFIQQTATKAEKVWKLQKTCNNVVTKIKELYFQIEKVDETYQIKAPLILDIQSIVRQQIEILQIVKCQQQSSMIYKKVSTIYTKLILIESTLSTIQQFQHLYFKIRKIMKINQISLQLPQSKSKFIQIQRSWNLIISHFIRDLQIWQCIDSQSYKNRISNYFKSLEQIYKEIQNYFNSKRSIFPRLFFITDQEIMVLLTEDKCIKNKQVLQKLFYGVKQLIIKKDSIQGVYGNGDEELLLSRVVNNQIVLWDKLKILHQSLKDSIKSQITLGSKRKKTLYIHYLMNELCQWTTQTQAHIQKNQLGKYLKKYLDQIHKKQLNTYSDYSLYARQISLRDILKYLIHQNITDIYCLNWKNCLRYYRTDQGITLKTFLYEIPFSFEYSGINNLFNLLTSARYNLHALMGLRALSTAFIGHKQTKNLFRQLSIEILHHYVDVSCPNSIQNVFMIIKGSATSITWVSVDEIQMISQQVASYLAHSLWQVQNAIKTQNPHIQYFKEDIIVPKSYLMSVMLCKTNLYDQNKEIKNNLMRLLARQITLIMPSWSKLLQLKLQSKGLDKIYIQKIIKRLEILQSNNGSQWYKNYFMSIVDMAYSNIPCQKWKQSQQVYIKIKQLINLQLTKEQQLILSHHLQQKQNTQISQINYINLCIKNKWNILLIGQPLSGKTQLIKSVFRSMNLDEPTIQKKYIKDKQNKKWEIIDGIDAKIRRQLGQLKIIQCINIDDIDPSIFYQMRIIYHRNTLNALDIIANYASSKNQKQIVNSIIQIGKTVLQKQLLKNSELVKFSISFIKMVQYWIEKQLITKIHAKEQVLMLAIWVYASLTGRPLNLAFYQTTLIGNPLNFYYNMEKSAWLQWVTFDFYPSFKAPQYQFYDVFVPLKQIIPPLYLSLLFAINHHLLVISSCKGIGRTTLINKIVEHNMHQKLIIHSKWNFNKCKNIFYSQMPSRVLGGVYCPSNKQTLFIVVDDIHLCDNLDPIQDFRQLADQSYSSKLKRSLNNFKLVFSRLLSEKQNNFGKRVHRYCVPIYIRQLDEQSMKTIFGYLFDWFFGNTQNPFSKQVRDMSNVMISSAIYIYKQIKKYGQMGQITNFRSLWRVMEGICKSSPKTVKTSKDIISLWYHQNLRVFQDSGVINNFDNILSQSLGKFSQKSPNKTMFYQKQTYQQVSIENLYKMFVKVSIELPIVIFKKLMIEAVAICRILVTHRGHILKIGRQGTSKKTTAKIASYLLYGKIATIISNNYQKWQNQLLKYFSQNYSSPTCLVFNIAYNQQQFLQTISEYLQTSQLRKYVFNNRFSYLQTISISSYNSHKYHQYVAQCKNNIHLVICLKKIDKDILIDYPSIVKCVSAVNVGDQWDRVCLEQIAEVTVGKFNTNYKICVDLYNKVTQKHIIKKYNNGMFIEWLKHSQQLYNQSMNKVKEQLAKYNKAIQKVYITIRQKEQFEHALKLIVPKLKQLNQFNEDLLANVNKLKMVYQNELRVYLQYQKLYNEQNQNVINKEKQCQEQLSEIIPLLKQAQESLQKVTRDDINQLRSFPNPPASAAKVVQALCFVFNQDHLVKEKVNQNGDKIRDFWQYAKKYILTDKLLKRVSQFKPQIIKQLPKQKVIQLKELIKKKQFEKQRVFKASIAAGNLSMWIKAVVSTFEVMQVIDPKRKAVNLAKEQLQKKLIILQQYQNISKKAEQAYLIKENQYLNSMKQQQNLINKIQNIKYQISQSIEFIQLLKIQQQFWEKKINQLKIQITQSIKVESIIIQFYLYFFVGCSIQEKNIIKKQMQSLFKIDKKCTLTNYYNIQYEILQLMNLGCPSIQENLESLSALLLKIRQKQVIIVKDQLQIFINILIGKYNCIIIDSLDYCDLESILNKLQNEYNTNLENRESSQLQPNKVIIIKNIQYHTMLIDKLDMLKQWSIINSYSKIIILLQSQTSLIKQLNLIDISNHYTDHYLQRQLSSNIFGIKNQWEEFKHMQNITNTKQQLIKILCSIENILLNEDQMDNWKQNYMNSINLAAFKVKQKKISNQEEQLISKLIAIESWKQFSQVCGYINIITDLIGQNHQENLIMLEIIVKQHYQLIIPHITLIKSNSQLTPLIWLYHQYNKVSLIHQSDDIKYIIQKDLIGFIPLNKCTDANKFIKQTLSIYSQYKMKINEQQIDHEFQQKQFHIFIIYEGDLGIYQGLQVKRYSDDQFINRLQSQNYSINNKKQIDNWYYNQQYKKKYNSAASTQLQYANHYIDSHILSLIKIIQSKQTFVKLANIMKELLISNKQIIGIKQIIPLTKNIQETHLVLDNHVVVFKICQQEQIIDNLSIYQIVNGIIQHLIN